MKKIITSALLMTCLSTYALDVAEFNPNEPLDIESMTNCGYFYEYASGLYSQTLTDLIQNKSIKSKKELQEKEIFDNYAQSIKSYMTLTSYLLTRRITLEDEEKYDQAANLLEQKDTTKAKETNQKCIAYVKSAETLNQTKTQTKIQKETTPSYLSEVLWKSAKKH